MSRALASTGETIVTPKQTGPPTASASSTTSSISSTQPGHKNQSKRSSPYGDAETNALLSRYSGSSSLSTTSTKDDIIGLTDNDYNARAVAGLRPHEIAKIQRELTSRRVIAGGRLQNMNYARGGTGKHLGLSSGEKDPLDAEIDKLLSVDKGSLVPRVAIQASLIAQAKKLPLYVPFNSYILI